MSLFDHPRVFDMPQMVAALRHLLAQRPEDPFSAATGQTVLDVGAGAGDLARLLPDTTVLALDSIRAPLDAITT